HSMVIDDHMRPLFAFLRTLTTPTSLFAAPEDWGDTALASRVERSAVELASLMSSGVARDISDEAWKHYQHSFGGNASKAEKQAIDVNFDTDLMRLATGGKTDRS